MNVFTFTGNLGNDCRVGSSASYSVVNFSVAVKSGFVDKEQTIWLDCALWGKQAEGKLKDYLVKGQQVAVSGELGTREHEGKTYITCRVSSCSLVGGKSDAGSGYQPQQQAPATQHNQQCESLPDDYQDDIPF